MSSFPEARDTGAPASGVVARNYSGLWILAATILGSSMAFIDSTAVNVALPKLQEDLNATIGDLQWTINAYVLFLASLLLVGGALGDALGRKRMFMVGITIFAAASVWAGFAPNATSLIMARALQGIGGAIFVPGSLALIGSCFTDNERGGAIGTWSSASALTTVAGPVLGGILSEELSWRWVFFINIPIAIVVLVICVMRVPESREVDSGERIDWRGGLLATLGLAGVTYGFTAATDMGLSAPIVILSLIVGVAALVGFVVTETKVPHPMMPLTVFRNRSFSGANGLTVFLYIALGGFLFYVPLNWVLVQGYSGSAAGLALAPFMAFIAIFSRFTGQLVTKIGANFPLSVGPALAGVGFLWLGLQGIEGPGLSTYMTQFFPGIALVGIGMAITIAPLVTVVMSTVDQRLSGLASGINNALSRTAMLLGVAVFGVLALTFFNGALDDRLDEIGASTEVVEFLDDERTKLAGAELPPGLAPADALATSVAIDESFLSAFRGVMIAMAVLAFLSAAVGLGVVEKNPVHGKQYE